MVVPGYRVVGELLRNELHVLERARREADGASVLLKRPLRPPRRNDLEALGRELALLGALELPGVARGHELLQADGHAALVLEDRGGAPLRALLSAGPLELPACLHLALELCAILDELHRREVILNGVHPGSVIFDPASRLVWLWDFAHASHGSAEAPPLALGALLPSSLPYLSPERTGRMNRVTDYRSDFYSLGATLYELLTGQPPFRSADPLELVHAHIARTPVPPIELRPELPEVVSRIVLKLLEKNAEARYQSARGLRADLELCAREWGARHAIESFPLGAHDFSERFLIPQHLYGREREVRLLTEAFDRACEGPAALMLVAGYSGVGKTSLIQELYRPTVRQRGHFISGKFDQVVRNIPFGALIQAFRGLVQQLLSASEESLSRLRGQLEQALGGTGRVLTEVIPEVALIIGEPAPVPELPPAETLNRFRLVFQNFVGVLAGRDRPLVVFLDDLQWADAASLGLLPSLLTSPEIEGLFLIGAYRDNEVGEGHLLSRSVAGLEAAGARVERITLGPLGLPDLMELVADCLRRGDPDVERLSHLVVSKTEGNPFFVRQFLRTLWQEGLLRFDHDGRRWTFRLDDIAQAPMTDNVVELMGRRIARLAPAGQEALTLAACVGNPFDVGTLAIVSGQPPAQAHRTLREAIDEGLLLEVAAEGSASDEGTPRFRFLHDRVQQAAYARLPEDRRQRLHLEVGRVLLESLSPAAAEEKLFEVVSHLNLGAGLITDELEQLSLCRLNLAAGQRAKASTAHQAALGYFKTGLQLVDASLWGSEYRLMFDLHREAAEAEYLCGQFDEAERRFGELLGRARSAHDKAQVHVLRLVQYESLSRYAEATEIGLQGLRLFGVEFPDDEAGKRAALEEEMRVIETLRAGRSIESLVELPAVADADTRMVLRLLTDVWAPAYISGDSPLVALVSARSVRLSIEQGNSEDSAYGYVTHAISVGPLRGEYAAAYEWGKLALLVNERFADQRRRAKIHQQFNAHVTLWRRPFATCIPHAQEACRSGLQTGDFTYAGYGAFTESWAAFLIGRELERFVQDFTPTLAVLRRLRLEGLAAAHNVMLNWAKALQGRTEAPLSLTDADFGEADFVAAYGDNPFFMTVFQVARLQLAALFEEPEAARAAAQRAWQLGPWGRGTLWPVLLDFWGGLAAAAQPSYEEAERRELGRAHEALAALAENCPENFRCFWLLLGAERERREERPERAFELYDEALRQARAADSLQMEALANELCGRLWQARGHEKVAGVYLGEARRCYREWGALAKVRQLEERYPWLAPAAAEPAALSVDVGSVTKAAHALAGEIVLEELLRKLMRITLENAGAQRGFFLHEKAGRLLIEAEGRVGHDVEVLRSLPLESSSGLSHGIVQYVRKTGEGVVIGDASTDRRFAGDPYIRSVRPRSVLCVPVVHQGKSGGILYLENNLVEDAFAAERIAVLDVLSTQAAIALENARLYDEMKQEASRRRAAEESLRQALEEVERLRDRLLAENVYLQEEIRTQHNFEEIVGTSPALMESLAQVERVSATDATVLILGETGVGKELFARAVHSRSARRERPLVKVNCGAIPDGLVESELFGHAKGAFTGALQKRTGRFELADGGTLFLDEVGELPLDVQVKLLRVLQEREFEPVGSSRTLRVDVRVIAASNRDLEELVRAGRFRADLLYRLNVFPLRVPALRERAGDVPLLVGFFVTGLAKRLGKPLQGFSRRDMERLQEYPWPGNVRELQNVVERAAILATGPVLQVPTDMLAPAREPAATSPRTLEDLERDHILGVLKGTGGVIEGPRGAAGVLGLHPNTLRSRMKKLGIAAGRRGV
jgi:predicted ATPase/transcriptional regulator with GAF, ATPase, and Fis domain